MAGTERNDQRDVDLASELAQPARRALIGAGCLRLEQVAERSEADIRELHGIGAKALDQLRRALHARGLSFADEERGRGSP